MGPIHAQAESIMKVLLSPATAVHVVTLLEDMPVQETTDSVTELRALGMPLGGVVVNQVRPPLLSPEDLRAALAGELDAGPLGDGVVAAMRRAGLGVPEDPAPLVGAMLAQAGEHAARVMAEDAHRKRLTELGLPLVDLPQLPGVAEGMDLAALHELADLLGGDGR
jgi:anion-transporting  ArsA/GET3 family ATPase